MINFSTNLYQRLLTGLILACGILYLLYFADLYLINIALGAFIIIAGFEWSKLIPLTAGWEKLAFILFLLASSVLLYTNYKLALYLNIFFWFIAIVPLCFYPRMQNLWGNKFIVGALGVMIIPLWAILVPLFLAKPEGRNFLLILFLLVCSTDIGGYFFGKLFGKHKLIPEVSPGKTIEGVLGGLLFSLVITLVSFKYINTHNSLSSWFIFCIITVLMSIVGDLFISMLKRRCGLKDTGTIFPGHGGLLDRFDSLLPTIPFFYLFLFICTKY